MWWKRKDLKWVHSLSCSIWCELLWLDLGELWNSVKVKPKNLHKDKLETLESLTLFFFKSIIHVLNDMMHIFSILNISSVPSFQRNYFRHHIITLTFSSIPSTSIRRTFLALEPGETGRHLRDVFVGSCPSCVICSGLLGFVWCFCVYPHVSHGLQARCSLSICIFTRFFGKVDMSLSSTDTDDWHISCVQSWWSFTTSFCWHLLMGLPTCFHNRISECWWFLAGTCSKQ